MRNLIIAASLAVSGCSYSGGEEIFFQADSATASSSWSDDYLIDHAIDGSGLEADFGPEDEHDSYRTGNHWTTEDGAVEGSWAWFELGQTVTLDTFYLWNHRSTSPPAFSENYAVTRFDLEFFDADDRRVGEVRDLTAAGNRADAQVYTFESTPGVRWVRLTILENAGEPRVTGLAEVAFGGVR